MTHTKWIVRLAVLVAFTAACSSTKETADDKVTVQGTVSEELYAADVQAVALGNDGRTFWAPVDVDGDFKLSLPTGQNYRVVLVRPASDGTSAVVAELAVTGGQGDATWLKGDHAATVRLGLIRAAIPAAPGAPAAQGSSLLKTASLTISRGGRGGRGGDDGLEDEAEGGRGGRGGHDGTDEDDADEWEDDQAHADDMGCHEGKPMDDDNGGVCTLTTTKTVHCSHGGEFAVYTTVEKEIVPCGADVQPPPADDTASPAPDDTESTDEPAADPSADPAADAPADCASPGLCG
jgi:hypothetical protein